MILIFGGAYQGKVDFAKERFFISDEQICTCTERAGHGGLKLQAKVLADFERAILGLVRENISIDDFLDAHSKFLADKIIILNDISQGVVPTDPVLRAWREATGKAMTRLASEASEVYRVFCGIGTRIK